MDDLEKQLSRARVKDKDGPIDRFGRQVALKGLEEIEEELDSIKSNEVIGETGCCTASGSKPHNV